MPQVPRPEPDWGDVHRELQRHKGVTLQLLWLEYRAVHPNGYQYSWYCEHYRAWREQLDVVMRQVYRAGEKVFVDYAGPSQHPFAHVPQYRNPIPLPHAFPLDNAPGCDQFAGPLRYRSVPAGC